MTTITGSDVRRMILGILVERPAATLPATAQSALYTVSGLVAVTQIVGVVTTICSATATNLSLVGNPTVGTDVSVTGTAAMANKEVGTLVVPTSLTSAAATVDVLGNANAGGAPGQVRPIILNTGTLDWLTSATNTGAMRWLLTYVPLESGASIVAA